MRWVSFMLAMSILLGVQLNNQTHGDPDVVAAYHQRVRSIAEELPYRVGEWLGVDEAPPPAAVQLLRPNVMLGRRFIDTEGRREAALVLVQCRDSRDMAGHYPPVCYPAHGWQWGEAPTQVSVQVAGASVPMTRYGFERSTFTTDRMVVIYGLFVLPNRGLAVDIGQVREAAADYRARGMGAAQVQVALGAGYTRDEELQIVGTLMESAWPVIEAVWNDGPGSRK